MNRGFNLFEKVRFKKRISGLAMVLVKWREGIELNIESCPPNRKISYESQIIDERHSEGIPAY